MHFTLRQAEQQVRASKSTILRAIKSGRLSAERDGAEGSYQIEASELFRVFDPLAQPETTINDMPERVGPLALEGATIAVMRAEIEKFAALLDAERQRIAELQERVGDIRAERDSWRQQAERLALTYSPTSPVSAQEHRPNLLERLGRALRR